MPRPRFQRAAPELRDALLDAAAQEFATHGYDAASTNRILVAAGLSKGAFYYYFDDKADLATAVLEREFLSFMDAIGELPIPASAEGFWAEMDRILNRSLDQLRRAPGRSDVITRLGLSLAKHPEILERIGPVIHEWRSRVTAFWKRGQEVGAVRTDLSIDAQLTLIQSMKLALASALFADDSTPTDEELGSFSRLHLDMVRRLVSPAPASTPKESSR